MQSLFNKQQLAVLAQVGTLVQPTTAGQFQNGGVALPINLFSHSDQEAQMQTSILDKVGDTGWAGRTADKIQSIYGGTFPIIISLAGTNIFCEELVAQAFQSNGDPTRLLNGFGGDNESSARLAALQRFLTFDNGLTLIQTASTTTGNAIQNGQTWPRLSPAAHCSPLSFPRIRTSRARCNKSRRSSRCALPSA